MCIRIILIKVALESIHVYYMFMFKMLCKVVIEKYQKDILWEGRSEKKDRLMK